MASRENMCAEVLGQRKGTRRRQIWPRIVICGEKLEMYAEASTYRAIS